MRPTLDPLWRPDLFGHPLAAVVTAQPHAVRWAPTPVPVPRIHDAPNKFSVTWALDGYDGGELEVEVVGEHLVLRASREGQVVSRAVHLPPGVDLSRRRDHWSAGALEVVVPRIKPTAFGRLRLAVARCLQGVARAVTPE